MEQKLDTVERRVLGVLMEKALTQPASYPMTVNTIIAACNQKSNRDPVMELDENTVWTTLNRLRDRGLVAMVLPGAGARTERFKHQLDSVFGWQRRQRAVVAELFLRGPQTVGELRTRCSRMVPFDTLEAISTTVDSLAQLDPPVVATLPRVPGQSAVRYTHLLAPDGEAPHPSLSATTHTPVAANQDSMSPSRLEQLEDHLARLENDLAELRRRLEAIETQLF